jgi:hypothetical protein
MPTQADAAHLERLLSEAGFARLSVTQGPRTLSISAPSEDMGPRRDVARLVGLPKQAYRLELAEGGRWRDARISGTLPAVVARLVTHGALGPPSPTAAPPSDSANRLERLRNANLKPRPPKK